MSTPTNHWKLGAFVLGGAILTMATILYLGASRLRREHVDYVSYLDESVQGLDVGSPVKFRGVVVGRVARIDVAPDRRHVAVTSALSTEQLGDLGLSEGEGGQTRLLMPTELRMQLVSQGLTGLKFLQIDFFDPRLYPAPVLSFAPPERYIPAAVSTVKTIESSVVSASDSLPEMMQGLTRVSDRAARMMEQLETQKLPEHLAETLAHLDLLLGHMNDAIVGLDLKGLSTQARAGIARLNATVARADAILERLDGDHGLFASAQRATDAFGDFATMSPDIGSDLSDTLHDIRAAATSIQRVADALERDPDMLIKGRKVAR